MLHPPAPLHERRARDTRFRPFMVALALASILTAVGAEGYHLIEGWAWMDSVYMVVITLSTVGFGEVHELSPAGRLWTVLILVSGVSLVGYTAARAIEFFTEVSIHGYRRSRKMQKQIDRMDGHIIVCGWGRVGRQVTDDLARANHPVVVIEREVGDAALELSGIPHVQGNAEQEAVLEAAGIARARVLISCVDSDTQNVFITLTARQMNPGLSVIARASEPEAARKLQLVGAERVVSPYLASGRRMSHLALRPQAVDFFDTLSDPLGDIGVEMHECAITAESPLAGRSLRDIDLRRSTGVIVVALRHAGQIQLNPDPDAVIAAGASLLALGTEKQCGALEKFIAGAD
jgi:voltage-gated potassium channel